MYIPSKWNNVIASYPAPDMRGSSPAEVVVLKSNEDTYYLKSVDAKYSPTTYSARREKDVMQWLSGKLMVPKVIDFGFEDNREYFVMSECKGTYIDKLKTDPEGYVAHLVKCIELFHSVDISDCPFDSSLNARLEELNYLLQNGLASFDDWKPTTKFANPSELYQWLCDHKPQEEELVFSHGDLTANIFVDGSDYWFYDLGRAGKADKWLDIAFCADDIRTWCKDERYVDQFFELLNLEPDDAKMEYFMLLDEMF